MTLEQLTKELKRVRENQLILRGNREQLTKSFEESKEALIAYGVDPDEDLEIQIEAIEAEILREGEEILGRLKTI